MPEINTNKKIWGLYCPEIYQPENVEKMLEIDVWTAINNIGAALFWEMHDRGKPWRQPTSIEEIINVHIYLGCYFGKHILIVCQKKYMKNS